MKNSDEKITITYQNTDDYFDLYVNGLNVVASGTLYLIGSEAGLLQTAEDIIVDDVDSGLDGVEYSFDVISEYCLRVNDFHPMTVGGDLDFAFVEDGNLHQLSAMYDYGYQEINIEVEDTYNSPVPPNTYDQWISESIGLDDNASTFSEPKYANTMTLKANNSCYGVVRETLDIGSKDFEIGATISVTEFPEAYSSVFGKWKTEVNDISLHTRNFDRGFSLTFRTNVEVKVIHCVPQNFYGDAAYDYSGTPHTFKIIRSGDTLTAYSDDEPYETYDLPEDYEFNTSMPMFVLSGSDGGGITDKLTLHNCYFKLDGVTQLNYKIEEGQGSLLYDSSIFHNHADITSPNWVRESTKESANATYGYSVAGTGAYVPAEIEEGSIMNLDRFFTNWTDTNTHPYWGFYWNFINAPAKDLWNDYIEQNPGGGIHLYIEPRTGTAGERNYLMAHTKVNSDNIKYIVDEEYVLKIDVDITEGSFYIMQGGSPISPYYGVSNIISTSGTHYRRFKCTSSNVDGYLSFSAKGDAGTGLDCIINEFQVWHLGEADAIPTRDSDGNELENSGLFVHNNADTDLIQTDELFNDDVFWSVSGLLASKTLEEILANNDDSDTTRSAQDLDGKITDLLHFPIAPIDNELDHINSFIAGKLI
jgi:hypothetical protein